MSSHLIEVRRAVSADMVEIEGLLSRLHAESLFASVSMSRPKLSGLVRSFILGSDKFCSVSLHEGRIDGLLMGYCAPFFFSEEKGVWDLAFYVAPERRGGRAALLLWKAFDAWAARQGACMVWLITSTGIRMAETEAFYLKLGLTRVGGSFMKRL